MNVEEYVEYCLSKPYAEETFPFDQFTLVMRVKGKMFAFVPLERSFQVTLKATPEDVIELQERYDEIMPGYHMNKKHWITVNVVGRISDQLLKQLTDESYRLVLKSLPKKQQPPNE